MSWDKGFNFRSTSGYVTDSTGETYVVGDSYPATRNGVTFGWEDPINTLNRDSGVDRRLAGINWHASSATPVFRVDVPSTGDYEIHVAAGDTGGSNSASWELRDNTTVFSTLTKASATIDEYVDASNVVRAESAWPTGEVALLRTMTSTIFRLRGSHTSNNPIAHLRLVQISSVDPPSSSFTRLQSSLSTRLKTSI